ncbi:hypothetical protein Tdes44962_MAKER02947 [Teratosphaeria destructans]|uniref:Uncharacterized protein n=1 Tax=Teratosphaeria destructans TaxID=418781 RepID=A0A9W7SRL3_9PEZI|nr:hypothetical protein Tdes44962_MAKER02947 [Teratosphaeria destructans]
MAISNEQFLFCCIENSNNGTVRWNSGWFSCSKLKIRRSTGPPSQRHVVPPKALRESNPRFESQLHADIFTSSIKYRRMKDKFGTISEGDRDGSAGGDADGDTNKTPKKKATPKKTPNKKRKADEDEAGADDAEANVVKGENADE